MHSGLESHAKHGPIATDPAGKETRDLAEQHSMRQWATSSTNMTRRQTMGHPGLKRAQLGDQSMCTGLGGEARTPARYALLALAPCISGDDPTPTFTIAVVRFRAATNCMHWPACWRNLRQAEAGESVQLEASVCSPVSCRAGTRRGSCCNPMASPPNLVVPNSQDTRTRSPPCLLKQLQVQHANPKGMRCEVDRNS